MVAWSLVIVFSSKALFFVITFSTNKPVRILYLSGYESFSICETSVTTSYCANSEAEKSNTTIRSIVFFIFLPHIYVVKLLILLHI